MGISGPAWEAFFKMIGVKLGAAIGPKEYADMGIRALKAEREFNQKAGFTNKDDRLPKFFYEEPLPPHNKVFLVSDEDLDSVHNY
jgi:aldehyde:ferredoxin oxidoreductase